MELRIIPMFATPFAQTRHPQPERLNAVLRELFLQRESQGARYGNPHPTMRFNTEIFESRFDLFKWPEPCIAELREFCFVQLYRFVGALSGFQEQALAQLRAHAEAWFHLTRRGGYFGVHNHPMATWSGVYCVDPAGSDTDPALGGRLTFIHPHGAVAMFLDPTVEALRLPYAYTTQEFKLSAGDLVLFPSWLMHHVTPYHGEGIRITVAFNAWFSRSAPG